MLHRRLSNRGRALSLLILVQTLSGCGRSAWTAQDTSHADPESSPAVGELGIQIDSLSSPVSEVVVGQREISVTVLVSNQGDELTEITRPALTFANQDDGTVANGFTQRGMGPEWLLLEPQQQATLEFLVDVEMTAVPGRLDVAAVVFARSAKHIGVVVRSAGQRLLWQVAGADDNPFLAYTLLTHPTAHPGQLDVRAQLHIANPSSRRFTIADARVIPTGEGLSTGLSVVAVADNPAEIPPAGHAQLDFSVTVEATANIGDVVFDAVALLVDDDGARLSLQDPRQRGRLRIVIPDLLIVTDDSDRDDTAGIPTVIAAGGLEDISLREAMLISNASTSGLHIRFDPAVFGDGGSATLQLLAPLPTITAPGTWIDGRGAQALINATGLPVYSYMISVDADDVTIEGLEFTASTSDGPGGIVINSALRTQLLALTMDGFGTNNFSAGAQIDVNGGSAIVVANGVFRGAFKAAIRSDVVSSYMHVTGNRFIEARGTSMELSGAHHKVIGNSIAGNGARLHNVTDGLWQRNTITASPTELLLRAVDGLVVRDSRFEFIRWDAITLSDGSQRVALINNVFDDNVGPPIINAGCNITTEAPQITDISGSTIQGTAPTSAVTVEIYRHSEPRQYYPELVTAVQDGNWQATLTQSFGHFFAVATSDDGATSSFSLLHTHLEDLVVTTADDEMDGTATMLRVSEAGGPGDLSFREALTIAANRATGSAISFSPTTFPPGAGTSIIISPFPEGLGVLPTVQRNYTVIDGAGADVTIAQPVDATVDYTLFSTATDVRISHLRFENCRGTACVRLRERRLRFEDNEIICNGDSRGIYYGQSGYDSSGATFARNRISRCGIGLELFHVSSAAVIDNEFFETQRGCINHNVGSAMYIDNRLSRCGTAGARLAAHATFVGNHVLGTEGPALTWTTDALDVFFNTFSGNTYLLWFNMSARVAPPVQIANNIIANQTLPAISIASLSYTVNEHHNLLFDNASDGITGAGLFESALNRNPDASDILADPAFLDPDQGNYTLGNSAAVDVGVDLGIDRNGALPGNYSGSAPDIGPEESP